MISYQQRLCNALVGYTTSIRSLFVTKLCGKVWSEWMWASKCTYEASVVKILPWAISGWMMMKSAVARFEKKYRTQLGSASRISKQLKYIEKNFPKIFNFWFINKLILKRWFYQIKVVTTMEIFSQHVFVEKSFFGKNSTSSKDLQFKDRIFFGSLAIFIKWRHHHSPATP